jgi:hypothetical protein
MNPLGAFSFGKIIKTFIPGLLAAAAVLLLVEVLYRISSATPCSPRSGFWGCFFAESFLRRVALVDPNLLAARESIEAIFRSWISTN